MPSLISHTQTYCDENNHLYTVQPTALFYSIQTPSLYCRALTVLYDLPRKGKSRKKGKYFKPDYLLTDTLTGFRVYEVNCR